MDESSQDDDQFAGTTQIASCSHSENVNDPEFDIGQWLNKSSELSTARKSEILKLCWSPSETYNFRSDAHDSKRVFIHSWLKTYAPWLAYSKKLKGALCLYCVLFPPTVVRGVLGSFIVKPFIRYKDMHDACKNHASSQWHKSSTKAAKSFIEDVPVDVMMISGHKKLIEENRKIISSLISIVIFCGSHDLPLRGKDQHRGKLLSIFFHFLQFNICFVLKVFSMISFI